MWISKYFILFIIFSFIGWVYESIYSIVKKKRWEKRGFLYGPVCPIYGCGAIAISLVKEYVFPWVGISYSVLNIFLVAFFGSAVLEFATSWILERIFHAVWWDYSELPFNIQGRISLITSICFGLAGIPVAVWFVPAAKDIIGDVSPILAELLALVLMAVLAMDMTITVSALNHFERVIDMLENSFNERMVELVNGVQEKNGTAKDILSLPKESVNNAIESMGSMYQRALLRVNEFRDRRAGKEYSNQLLEAIKTRIRGA